jgi:mRNA-degrading endonuclease RelE of RelBE toxin-antitoxin system
VANSSHLNGIFLWVFNVEENARKEFHKLSKRKEKKRKERIKEVCYILQRDWISLLQLDWKMSRVHKLEQETKKVSPKN